MDGTAVAVLLIGLLATVAAMALPLAYPGAPIIVWRGLFWFGIAGMIAASAYLGATKLSSQKSWATAAVVVSGISLLISLVWFFTAPAASKSPPTATLPPQIAAMPPVALPHSSVPANDSAPHKVVPHKQPHKAPKQYLGPDRRPTLAWALGDYYSKSARGKALVQKFQQQDAELGKPPSPFEYNDVYQDAINDINDKVANGKLEIYGRPADGVDFELVSLDTWKLAQLQVTMTYRAMRRMLNVQITDRPMWPQMPRPMVQKRIARAMGYDAIEVNADQFEKLYPAD